MGEAPDVPGNIDLHARPIVKNGNEYSTVRSITVGFGDKTYVLPTVIGDKIVSNDEAIAEYRKTGKHLGAFKDSAKADAFAQRLHEEQAKEYGPKVKAAKLADEVKETIDEGYQK